MTKKTMKSWAMLACVSLLAAAGAAQAQELKIGYVNSERVLREATPAKAALARATCHLQLVETVEWTS